MTIISTREFRAHQSKYLSMAAAGHDVILKSRSFGSFTLNPVMDDSEMSRDEFYAMIDRRVANYEKDSSKAIVVGDNETSDQLLQRIIASCTQ